MANKKKKSKKRKKRSVPKTRSAETLLLIKMNHKAGPHKDKKKKQRKEACRKSVKDEG